MRDLAEEVTHPNDGSHLDSLPPPLPLTCPLRAPGKLPGILKSTPGHAPHGLRANGERDALVPRPPPPFSFLSFSLLHTISPLLSRLLRPFTAPSPLPAAPCGTAQVILTPPAMPLPSKGRLIFFSRLGVMTAIRAWHPVRWLRAGRLRLRATDVKFRSRGKGPRSGARGSAMNDHRAGQGRGLQGGARQGRMFNLFIDLFQQQNVGHGRQEAWCSRVVVRLISAPKWSIITLLLHFK